MRRLWDRSKFKPNDFLMAVCGHDCESDSKMQYCRVFCYKIDETRCTVVSFNEKLIKNMHFPIGKQWGDCETDGESLLVIVKPIGFDWTNICFQCRLMICLACLLHTCGWGPGWSSELSWADCEAIVSRLWVGCRIELLFWVGFLKQSKFNGKDLVNCCKLQ